MAKPSIVISINGEGAANLRVECSCGWKPSMGGAIEFMLPILKTFLKQHNGPGHVLDVKDPFMLLAG